MTSLAISMLVALSGCGLSADVTEATMDSSSCVSEDVGNLQVAGHTENMDVSALEMLTKNEAVIQSSNKPTLDEVQLAGEVVLDELQLAEEPCAVSFHAVHAEKQLWVTAGEIGEKRTLQLEHWVNGKKQILFGDIGTGLMQHLNVAGKEFQTLESQDPAMLAEIVSIPNSKEQALEQLNASNDHEVFTHEYHADKFQQAMRDLLHDKDTISFVVALNWALKQHNVTVSKYHCIQPFYNLAMHLAQAEDPTSSTSNSDGLPGPWDPAHPDRPYADCGNTHLGLCGLGANCWEHVSGCDGCGCNRWCEYHDHYCSCWKVMMGHHVCWMMLNGGWGCEACAGPDLRAQAKDFVRGHYTENISNVSMLVAPEQASFRDLVRAVLQRVLAMINGS